MKFVAGLGVSTLSGSQAGTTASRNANGAYFRNRAKPINKNSESQKRSRAVFSQVAGIWGSLSSASKQSFIDNANSYPYVDSLGQTKVYTGQQLCMKANNVVLQALALDPIGTSGFNSPIVSYMLPKPSELPVVNNLSVFKSNSGTWDLSAQNYEGLPVSAGNCILISATSPQSNGVTAPKDNMFRCIGYLGEDYSGGTVNCLDAYKAVFGEPTSEAVKIWFRAAYIKGNVGLLTNYFQSEFSFV